MVIAKQDELSFFIFLHTFIFEIYCTEVETVLHVSQMVFNIAEAVLRAVGQNSRLSISRTQAGWLMMGALMTMGEELKPV